MQKPRCSNPKCEAEYSKFLVQDYSIGGESLVLLYCSECGAVQGVVHKDR
jgi:hypothetical protein